MKYNIFDGKLIISGSLAEYGLRNSRPMGEIFPIGLDSHALESRVKEDNRIRDFFAGYGRLPEDISAQV